MKEIIMRNLKERLYLIILFFAIISIFLVNFTYVSLIISFIALILSFIFSRRHIRILVVTIIISLATIITDGLVIYNDYQKTIDVFKDRNVIEGSWEYNEYGGKYVFKDDFSYIQYSNSNTEDNYCVGKYEYSYGGVSSDGVVIREDINYYYYDLKLKEDYCIIMGKENYDKYNKEMIFSIGKLDNNDVWMMNKESNSPFKITKIID